MIYLSPLDDSQQDVAIGDFRAYCRELLGASSILEIGPSYMPLFPKKEGFDVSIVDHADGDTIREKYKSMGVDTSLIEDVDYVWKGGPISGLLDGKKFDCIYSSHVIEHTTDFVRFLQDCEVILNSSGLLVFIIPDKRFCFDLLQPITDTAKILS